MKKAIKKILERLVLGAGLTAGLISSGCSSYNEYDALSDAAGIESSYSNNLNDAIGWGIISKGFDNEANRQDRRKVAVKSQIDLSKYDTGEGDVILYNGKVYTNCRILMEHGHNDKYTEVIFENGKRMTLNTAGITARIDTWDNINYHGPEDFKKSIPYPLVRKGVFIGYVAGGRFRLLDANQFKNLTPYEMEMLKTKRQCSKN